MADGDVKTDRELLLLVNQQVQTMEQRFSESINRLSDSIVKLGESMEKMEESKIGTIDKRLASIERWQIQIMGGYRVLVIVSGVLGAAISWAANKFL